MEGLEPDFLRQMDRFTRLSVTEARKLGISGLRKLGMTQFKSTAFSDKGQHNLYNGNLSKLALIVANLG